MSRNGKDVPALARALKSTDSSAVTLREYPGAHREILNDRCRLQARRDLIIWLQRLYQS